MPSASVLALLATAATSGALLGFGARVGTPARGFNAFASLFLGDRAAGVWGWDGTVTPAGIALQVAVMAGWGLLYARLAGRLRGWRPVAAALGVAVAGTLVTLLASRRVAADVAAVLGSGQVVALHLILAVALAAGIRFARGTLRSDGASRAAPARDVVTQSSSVDDDSVMPG